MSLNFEKMIKIEKEKRLFERKYKGIYYWQSIRLDVVKEIDAPLEKKESIKKVSFFNCIKYCAKNLLKDILILNSLEEYDILYFDQCGYRYVDNEQKDPYFDFFELEEKYKIFRCLYMQKDSLKEGIGISIPLIRYYISKVLSKLVSDWNVDKLEEEFIESTFSDFSKEKNFCGISYLKQEAKNIFFLHKAYQKYYKKLLKKCKPKMVFVVCHYDKKLYPLYEVCKNFHIPVIELQHGLSSGVHAYSYSVHSSDGIVLPRYIFTYGTMWEKYMNMPYMVDLIPIGNAFLENRKNKYYNQKIDSEKIIIYSFPDGRELLVNLAIELSKLLNGYDIVIKLHPREMEHYSEVEKAIKGESHIMMAEKEVEIYQLLATAKHHVAISSTVLYEAAIFNTERYVLILDNYIQRMQPLIDAGLACSFTNSVELADLIVNSNCRQSKALEEDNVIWKKNAKRNVQEAIKKIIGDDLNETI